MRSRKELEKRVAELERHISRLFTAEGAEIRLFKNGPCVVRGRWWASVDGYEVLGDPVADFRGVNAGLCEGFKTAAEAQKAAEAWVESRPVVRVKS